MVFNAEKDAALAGVIAAIAQAIDGPLVGLFTVYPGLAAGKDADMRRAEQGSVIDPLLYIGNLRVALGPLGRENITDGVPLISTPAQKRMPPKVCQIFGRDVVPEK